MTTTTTLPAMDRSRTVSHGERRFTAILLLVEGLLIFVPTIVLGAAIGWPASLDYPAEQILPLLATQLDQVRLGYGAYLLYSLLFFPTALLATRALTGVSLANPLLQIGIGFAALSTLARSIGIIRWLSAMPVLAELYGDPAQTESGRAMIATVFTTTNAFGGAVGEALGVSLCAAVWFGTLAFILVRRGSRWLGGAAAVVALLLVATALELLGVAVGPLITVSTTGVQLWFIAAGVKLLASARSAAV